MSNRKEERPVNREISEFMQSAANEYFERENGGPVPLDRRFMAEPKNDKLNFRVKRYLTIAASIAIIIVVGSIFGTLITSQNAYGDKGVLHRIYKAFIGVSTDKQDEDDSDAGETFEIHSMDQIEEAKEFCENLYIPEYIPKGYQLKSLKIEQYITGSFIAEYSLKDDNKHEIQIIVLGSPKEGDTTFNSGSDGKLIEEKDRKILISEDEGAFNAEVFLEDALIRIFTELPEAEVLRLARSINQ